ncbi:unnamed protein product [Prorocentrum cordatum]|uniref:Uncharacterized protein n=1 Tax=Prorocentrum cordatum TaxID=2364126 RepID=A0ABN9TET8_9DINO|nr:unnamed protein product [Polarella glacialis]
MNCMEPIAPRKETIDTASMCAASQRKLKIGQATGVLAAAICYLLLRLRPRRLCAGSGRTRSPSRPRSPPPCGRPGRSTAGRRRPPLGVLTPRPPGAGPRLRA